MIKTAAEARKVSIDALLAIPEVSTTLSRIQSLIDIAAGLTQRSTSYWIDEDRTGLTQYQRERLVQYLEELGYKISYGGGGYQITISW